MMSNEQGATISEIEEVLKTYEPPDDAVFDMMPEETADFIREAPENLRKLLDILSQRAKIFDSTVTEIGTAKRRVQLLEETIKEYALQSGEGEIMLQNLRLVSEEVRRRLGQ